MGFEVRDVGCEGAGAVGDEAGGGGVVVVMMIVILVIVMVSAAIPVHGDEVDCAVFVYGASGEESFEPCEALGGAVGWVC